MSTATTPRMTWRTLRVRWPRPRAELLVATLAPAAVMALTAVAAYTRMRTALGAPLWIDEGISIGIAKHPLTAIPGLLREDGSPPGYYLLLHWWIGLFGASPSSTHMLSVVFAVLAVPACAWAAWPFSPRAGVIAAALAAFSPFAGEYADETRMYSLAFLLAALASGAFVRAFGAQRSRPWAAGFGALTALLCLTHGWGVFFAAGAVTGLGVALVLGPDRRRLAFDALISAAVGAVLFGAWVPTLLFQVAHTGAPWSHQPSGRSLVRAGSRMLGGRAPETVLLVVGLGGLLGAVKRVRAALSLAVLAVLTVVVAYIASRASQPAWALRYLVVPLAPLAVAMAAGLDRARAAGVLAALAVCVLFWAGKPSAPALSDKSNVDEMAAMIGAELPAGTLVASPQPEQVPVLHYYLPGRLRYVTPLGPQRDVGVVDWVDALRRMRASRVGATLGAAVRRFRPGQRVLLVAPRFGRPDAPWTKAVAHLERRWHRRLARDRHLVLLARYVPARYASRTTVAGFLYERLRAGRRAARALPRVTLGYLPATSRRMSDMRSGRLAGD